MRSVFPTVATERWSTANHLQWCPVTVLGGRLLRGSFSECFAMSVSPLVEPLTWLPWQSESTGKTTGDFRDLLSLLPTVLAAAEHGLEFRV